MADDQDASNDVGEGGDAPEVSDYEESTSTASVIQQTTSSLLDDYDDEPIEDYVVKLVVDDQSSFDAKSPIQDYSTALYDELSGNGTAITGGKRWWGKFIKQKLEKKEKKKGRDISICVCV
jgi:hypothetical protein